jgi:sialic acid synthase SpsE
VDFIRRFAEAGADLVKFQLTRVQYLRPWDEQYEWFSQCERPTDWYAALADECRQNGVEFLCTVFTPQVVPELRSLSNLCKIGSGESHNKLMAQVVMEAGFERVYVSNGINPIHRDYTNHPGLIEVGALSIYPTPIGMVSRALSARMYDGWSDHSIGTNECQMAAALGVTYLEKHVWLKNQARDPQPWEASLDEFRALRRFVDTDKRRFLGRWQHKAPSGRA